MTIKNKIILQVVLLCLVLGALAAYLVYGTWKIDQRLKAFEPATEYLLGIADVELGLAGEIKTIWTALAARVPLDKRDVSVHHETVNEAFDRLIAAAEFQRRLGVPGEEDDLARAQSLRELYQLWQTRSTMLLESGQASTELTESARLLLEDQLFPGLAELIEDGVEEVGDAYFELEDALSFFPWLQRSARHRIRLIEHDLNFVIGGNQVYTLLNRQFAALQAFNINGQHLDLGHFQELFDVTDRALTGWHKQAVDRLRLSPGDTERILDLNKVVAAQESYVLLHELTGSMLYKGNADDIHKTIEVMAGQIESLVQGSLRPAVMASIHSGIRSVQTMAETTNQLGVIVLAGLLITVVLLAIRSVRHFLGSLRVLQFGIEAFQSGNLAHRITVQGRGEFAELGSSLNEMAEKLHSSQQEIEDLNASLERRVDERTRMLEEANQELRSFNYMVSHDLRNPLSAVLGLGQVLLERARANQHDDQVPLQHVVTSAERMDKTINALLSLSQVAYQPLRYDAVDLADLARQTFDQLVGQSPQRQARLEVAETLKVIGDPDLLYLAVENLVQNAWKYSDAERTLQIALESFESERGEGYRLRDNGPGFSLSEAGDIFSPFSRLQADKDIDGSGIGLAIVERIIHRHGGDIWVESAPGAGACFYFTLGNPLEGDVQ